MLDSQCPQQAILEQDALAHVLSTCECIAESSNCLAYKNQTCIIYFQLVQILSMDLSSSKKEILRLYHRERGRGRVCVALCYKSFTFFRNQNEGCQLAKQSASLSWQSVCYPSPWLGEQFISHRIIWLFQRPSEDPCTLTHGHSGCGAIRHKMTAIKQRSTHTADP